MRWWAGQRVMEDMPEDSPAEDAPDAPRLDEAVLDSSSRSVVRWRFRRDSAAADEEARGDSETWCSSDIYCMPDRSVSRESGKA